MSITIGSATFSNLTAQPFGYEEADTRFGRTARQWSINGLLTPLEWLDLLDEYDAWREDRILDEDTKISGVVGTTVDFSGTGPGDVSWTSVPCWFTTAPVAEQIGGRLAVTVVLVDAAQALQLIQKEEEIAQEDVDLPDLGTVTVGTAVLKLLKPMETYGAIPTLQLTAAGVNYVTGPLVVSKVRDIEGTTDLDGWNAVLSWFESTIVSIPATNDWFPISAPTASAQNKIVDGVKEVEYSVTIQLGKVI